MMSRLSDVCGYRYTGRLYYRVSYAMRPIDRSIDELVLAMP